VSDLGRFVPECESADALLQSDGFGVRGQDLGLEGDSGTVTHELLDEWVWRAGFQGRLLADQYQIATANSRQLPGMPLRSCSPRSVKLIPDPTTRSFTI
jgi:hypothetical protein